MKVVEGTPENTLMLHILEYLLMADKNAKRLQDYFGVQRFAQLDWLNHRSLVWLSSERNSITQSVITHSS